MHLIETVLDFILNITFQSSSSIADDPMIPGLLIFLIIAVVLFMVVYYFYGFEPLYKFLSWMNDPGPKWVNPVEKARQDYQTSLNLLKDNPTNADLRQRTLKIGRLYSNLTRDKKGVTIYDEMALMNDINAACAGASVMAAQQSLTRPEERLKKLKELHDQGLISNDEYAMRKERILDKV